MQSRAIRAPYNGAQTKVHPRKKCSGNHFTQGLYKKLPKPVFAMSSRPKYNVRTLDITPRSALAVVRNSPSGLIKNKKENREC
jgi:hypothetical protein